MGRLDGKVALITGGGTGIGKAIAARFHAEGAFVVIAGRRRAMLEAAAASIAPDGERFGIAIADMTSDEDIARLVEETVRIAGKLDIVVNNAGIMRFGSLPDTPLAEWEAMFRTNAFGPWRLMVHALPYLKQAGGGSIVNISSIAGIKALPGAGVYCASKAALQMISQVMALEAAKDRVRVNLLNPAIVEDTELADPIFGREGVPAFYDRMRDLHPLGRNGRPKDIADAALFFASDESDWVSGVMLSVDGGRHLATNRPSTA